MGDSEDYFPAVSVHLCRALDELGMNALTVKRRRDACLFKEQICCTALKLTHANMTVYNFGSQTEGTTTPGINSDSDVLTCLNDYVVIQDWVDWQKGVTTLLMLQDDTAPGYCRLQLLRTDVPMAKEYLPNEDFVYDRDVSDMQSTRNGPANSIYVNACSVELDSVAAFRCKSWPLKAEHWKRHRHTNWPTQSLIQKAVESGCFLVPVGYKYSKDEHLEWRISFSLAEQILMFNLNITYLKCYVVLKMVMKSIVVPSVGESISSYHCKNALFHCIEETGRDYWTEENLLMCINRCLYLLFTWVQNGHCPHFIIPDSNLFAGKITPRNRHKVLSVLKNIIESRGCFLLSIPTDDIGYRLSQKLNTLPINVQILNSCESIEIIGAAETGLFQSIAWFTKQIMTTLTTANHPMAIQNIFNYIRCLWDNIRQADKYERRAIRLYFEFLSCLLGSVLTSASLSLNNGLPREALKCFRIGTKDDIAASLKLASVLFCCNMHVKAGLMLQNVEMAFESKQILSVCFCYPSRTLLSHDLSQQMYATKNEKARQRYAAHCVRFCRPEILCVPPSMRYEMFRSMGDDIQRRDPLVDEWMVLCVADALPFMFYLQYLNYGKLGKRELQERALHNLDSCTRRDTRLRHLETAWNLLGLCMEMEDNRAAAMDCYTTSLEVRPRNNAANWLIGILIYRGIMGEHSGQMREVIHKQ